MRTLAVSLLGLCLLAVGCSSSATVKGSSPGDSAAPSTGGSPGAGSGGAGGTGGGGGAPSTGGAVGSGGSAGTGGGGGSGGTGGATTGTPDAAADGPAPIVTTDGGGIPGHEWVIPCQAGWSREQCCNHYCTCMMTNCSARAPANCMATCTAPGNDWNLKCRVEQCFESLDPRFPMDKGSHCGHAIEKAHCQGIIP